jgi:methanogenic corrinoid protein MtbC1
MTTTARLTRAIEGEILPRLIASHFSERPRCAALAPTVLAPNARDVAQFAKILLADDAPAARRFVDGLLAHRVPLESIFLDLMTPTARRLGDLWSHDLCHFADVTVALGRLQQLLRDLSQTCICSPPCRQLGRRALIVSVPSEQHTFGPLMVAEFLRRAGWDVAGEPGLSRRDILSCVRSEWFALIGLSLSCERHLGALAPLIESIRRASRNNHIVILVGGHVFREHPDWVVRVGADTSATDAREVVACAESAMNGNALLATVRSGA